MSFLIFLKFDKSKQFSNMVQVLCSLMVLFLSNVCAVAHNRSLGSVSNKDVWCGRWAGNPDPAARPMPPYEVPPGDPRLRLFAEPQLQQPPFGPLPSRDPIVQLPKLFGRGANRVFSTKVIVALTYVQHNSGLPY